MTSSVINKPFWHALLSASGVKRKFGHNLTRRYTSCVFKVNDINKQKNVQLLSTCNCKYHLRHVNFCQVFQKHYLSKSKCVETNQRCTEGCSGSSWNFVVFLLFMKISNRNSQILRTEQFGINARSFNFLELKTLRYIKNKIICKGIPAHDTSEWRCTLHNGVKVQCVINFLSRVSLCCYTFSAMQHSSFHVNVLVPAHAEIFYEYVCFVLKFNWWFNVTSHAFLCALKLKGRFNIQSSSIEIPPFLNRPCHLWTNAVPHDS